MSERERNANTNAMKDDYPDSETDTEKQGNLSRQADYGCLNQTREIATQASDATTRNLPNSTHWTSMSASLKSSQSSRSHSSSAVNLNTQETTRIISQTPAKKAYNNCLEMPGEKNYQEKSNSRDFKAINQLSHKSSQPLVLQSPSSTSHPPTKKSQGQHQLFQLELHPQSLEPPSQNQTQSQSQSLLDSPSQSPSQFNSRKKLTAKQPPSEEAARRRTLPENSDSMDREKKWNDDDNSVNLHARTENMKAHNANLSNHNTASFNRHALKAVNQPKENDRDIQNTVIETETNVDVEDYRLEDPEDNIIQSNYSYYRGTTRDLLTQPQSSQDEDDNKDGKEDEDYPSDCEYGFPMWKSNGSESKPMIAQEKGEVPTPTRQESELHLQIEPKESSKSSSNIFSNDGGLIMLSAVCSKEERNGMGATVVGNAGERPGASGDDSGQFLHPHVHSDQTGLRYQNNYILQQQLEKQQGPGEVSQTQHGQQKHEIEHLTATGIDRTSPGQASDGPNQNQQNALQPPQRQQQDQRNTEEQHHNEQEHQQTKESCGKNENSVSVEDDQAPLGNGSGDLNQNLQQPLHRPLRLQQKQQQDQEEEKRHELQPNESRNGDSTAIKMDHTHPGNGSGDPRTIQQLQPPLTSDKQQQDTNNSQVQRQKQQLNRVIKPTAIHNESSDSIDIAPAPKGKELDESNPNQQHLPHPLAQKHQQELQNPLAQQPRPQQHLEIKRTATHNETSDAIEIAPAPEGIEIDDSNPNKVPQPMSQKQQLELQNPLTQQPRPQEHREMTPNVIHNDGPDAMDIAPLPERNELDELNSSQQLSPQPQSQTQQPGRNNTHMQNLNKERQHREMTSNVCGNENATSMEIGAFGLDDSNQSKQHLPQPPPGQDQLQGQQNMQEMNSKENHQQQQMAFSNAGHNESSTAMMVDQVSPRRGLDKPNPYQQQLPLPSPQQPQHDQENAPVQQQQQQQPQPPEQLKTKPSTIQNGETTIMEICRVCPWIGLDDSSQSQQQRPQPPPQQKYQEQTLNARDTQQQQINEVSSQNANSNVMKITHAPSGNRLEELHQNQQKRQFPREKEQAQELTHNRKEQHQQETDAIRSKNNSSGAMDIDQVPPGKVLNTHVMRENELQQQQQQAKDSAGKNESFTAMDIDYISPGNVSDESHEKNQQPPEHSQTKTEMQDWTEQEQDQQADSTCSQDRILNAMAEKMLDQSNQNQHKQSQPPRKQQQDQQNTHTHHHEEQHSWNQKQQQKDIYSTTIDIDQASPEETADNQRHLQKHTFCKNEEYKAIDVDRRSSIRGGDNFFSKNIPVSKASADPFIRVENDLGGVANVEGVSEVNAFASTDISAHQAVMDNGVVANDGTCSSGKNSAATDPNLANVPLIIPEISTTRRNGTISGLTEKSFHRSSPEARNDKSIVGNTDETKLPSGTENYAENENENEAKSIDPGSRRGGTQNSIGLMERNPRLSLGLVVDEEYKEVTGLSSHIAQTPSKASYHQERKQQCLTTTERYELADLDHPSLVEGADEPPPKDSSVAEINSTRLSSHVDRTDTKSNAETIDHDDLTSPNVMKCEAKNISDNESSSKTTEQSRSERIQDEVSPDINDSKQSKSMCPPAESTKYTPWLQNIHGDLKECVRFNSSSGKGTLSEVDQSSQMERQPVQKANDSNSVDKIHGDGTSIEDKGYELKSEVMSLKANGVIKSAPNSLKRGFREQLLSPALSGLTEHSQPETPRQEKNAFEKHAGTNHAELEQPKPYRPINANKIWTSSIDEDELQGLTEDAVDHKDISVQVEINDGIQPSNEGAETKKETSTNLLSSGRRSFSSQTTELKESPNESYPDDTQILLSGLHTNAKAEMENTAKVDGVNHDDESTKGTEDAQTPSASGSVGWSLYAGDTQPLPTAPTFGQHVSISAKSSALDAANDEIDSGNISKRNINSTNLGNNEVVEKKRDAEFTSNEDMYANNQTLNDPIGMKNSKHSDESRAESQYKDMNLLFDGEKSGTDRNHADSSIGKISSALDPSESRGELMKHTPDNDTHPMVPYPDDHIVPNFHESYTKVCEPGERSQESQDVLDGSRNVMTNNVENRPIDTSTNDNDNGVSGVNKPASRNQSTFSKGLKLTKESNDVPWTSTNYYPSRNENRSPPRLVLPSFKTSDNKMENEPSNRDVAGQNLSDAFEDKSWCQPVANGYESDFIEDTQSQEHRQNEEKRFSSLKRLSRGPSTSTKNDDESTSEEEFQSQNYQSQSSTSIGPKVLSYGMEDDVRSNSSASTSTRSRHPSASEVDERDSSEVDIEPSQTNINIRKQLKKMKSMTKNLPDAKELKYIISREELLEKIDYLHRKESDYKSKINHYKAALADFEAENGELKREIEKLRKRIKDKNSLLFEQAKYLETYAEFQESLQRMKKDIEISPRPTRGHSPKTKRMKRRREHDIQSDDSDTIPLSKLKRSTPTIDTSNDSYKKRTRAETPHDKHFRSNIASNNPTPNSNGPMSAKRPPEPKEVSTKVKKSSPLSSDVWKVLQEKGWTYRTGPEPFNKVYVPKDGATHPGTQLGIHFFHSDQVVQEAVRRGDLSPTQGKMNPNVSELAPIEMGNETKKISSKGHGIVSSESPFYDSEYCLQSQLLTLETAELCISLATSFARTNSDEAVSFRGLFFDPLWQRLKTQGSDIGFAGMNWRYEKNPDTLSTRNWCFVTPCSKVGVKGKLGEDYFVSEEQLVLRVMREVVSLQDKPVALSQLISDNEDCISTLLSILTRAVEENLEFHEARDGKSSSVRSSRVRGTFQREETTPTKGPNPTLKNTKHSRGSKESTPVKRSPSTTLSKIERSSNKKSKISDSTAIHLSPAFHLSQSQSAAPQVPNFQHRSPPSKKGSLSGFYFLMSGVDKVKLSKEIKRLGGEPTENFSLIKQEKFRTKTFFLSDYGNWRNPKYIIAASMGVPMLHHNWVTDISKEQKDHGMAKVFSSDLYSKHRLPTGLDISTGVFALQRASHARRFLKPGVDKDGGNAVFDGMRIALGLENGAERSWKFILETCGAKVETVSTIASANNPLSVDCCLFDSATLPPQETSVPVVVSRLMKYIDHQVPRLDLAWAHQCIIQRRRLPLRGEPRYSVSLEGSFHDSGQIFSFKSKAGNRYGVGDLVQISRGQKSTSKGRILSITWKRHEMECQFEVQLLENGGDYELVDCSSSAKVSVNEKCLQGNIVMLNTRDFNRLGYIPTNPKQSNIFLQTRPSKESQR